MSPRRVVLESLNLTADPVALSLAMAPFDDEPDDDDFDGGLSEAKREADEGRLLSHDEIKKGSGFRELEPRMDSPRPQ